MILTAFDKLVDSFLHPIIAPFLGMPNYEILVYSIYKISHNTASMHTTLRGVKLGFLVLTVYPTVHATLFTTPFGELLNPGPAPMIPPNSASIEQTSIQYKFTLETQLLLLYTNINMAPKNIWGSLRIVISVT